jgi:hypothetical protein
MSEPDLRNSSRFAKVFGVPALLAVLTLLGLLVALFDDGLLDAFAWCALALPVAVVPWAMLKARRAAPGNDTGGG